MTPTAELHLATILEIPLDYKPRWQLGRDQLTLARKDQAIKVSPGDCCVLLVPARMILQPRDILISRAVVTVIDLSACHQRRVGAAIPPMVNLGVPVRERKPA